jgi:hypothetical protein
MDGKLLGKTPFAIELDAGTGKLAYVVRHAGHKEALVEIPADKGGSESVKLVPVTVKVAVSSEPAGAEVYAPDGKLLGKTPLNKELPAGTGVVAYTLKLAGYKDGRVEISADKGGAGSAKLVASTVTIALRSEPAGAEVIGPDGKTLGKTPLEKDIPAGTGVVAYTLKLAGHKDGRVELPADKGGKETVKLVAEPRPVVATPPPPETPKPAPTGTKPAGGKKNKPVGDKVINPFAK